MTDAEAAYIAGFIDGEGCITLSRKKDKTMISGHCYRPHISVTNTNKEVIYWLRDTTFLGNIHIRNPKGYNANIHKIAYSWQLWSKQACYLLNRVLPFLRVKRHQALLLIEFNNNSRQPGRRGLSEMEHQIQDEAYSSMRLLNQQGGKQ